MGRPFKKGTFVASSESKYVGDLKKGYAHGSGEAVNNSIIYSGNWIKGKASGNFFVRIPRVGRYIGQFKDSYPHG